MVSFPNPRKINVDYTPALYMGLSIPLTPLLNDGMVREVFERILIDDLPVFEMIAVTIFQRIHDKLEKRLAEEG
jgi:hypothetical protein